MRLARLHRLALTASATIATVGVMNGSALLFGAGAALIAVMWATSGQLLSPTRAPARAWATHGLTLAVLAAAFVIFRSARIDAVLIIVMLGIFNRFVLRQGPRDDFIIVGASSVLLAATTTITPGVAFLLIIVLFVPATLWALYSSTLLGLADSMPEAQQARWTARLQATPAPKQRAFIAGASLAFMVIGYVVVSIFPRYHFGRFLSTGYFMTLPGASTEMQLTAGGASPTTGGGRVLRVEPNPDYDGAELSGLYARLYVLDQFDGETFSAGQDGGAYALYPQNRRVRVNSSVWGPEDGPNTVKVTLERLVARESEHPLAALGRDAPAFLKLTHAKQGLDGGWKARFRHTAVKIVYKVDLDRRVQAALLPPRLEARREARVLHVPDSVDPRLRALAAQLTEGLEEPADKIRAIVGHFEGSEYTYSLDPLEGESADPLARFVFEAKQGHCELYAGAVAVLLRLSGVPARVASGYYGGWWNSSGGFLEFSDQDAHAWVEARDPDRGWIWVDATPETLRSRRTEDALAWVRDLYDAVEALWFENVIDFDERKRQALLGKLAIPFDLGAGGPLGGGGGGGSGGLGLGAGLAALLVLLAGAGGLLWIWRRRQVGVEALGQRLRDALDPHAPPAAPLGALLAAAPDRLWTDARVAVARYEALRFDDPARAPDRAAVEAAVRQVERAAAALKARGAR